MLRKFVSPEILSGFGARHQLPVFLNRYNCRKPMIVSDPGLRAAGWTEELENILKNEGLDFVLWEEVSPNPRSEEVSRGAEYFKKSGCDLLIALGGGSPMDAAKGIGTVASNGGTILGYVGVDKIPEPLPPMVFIPSTSGSAADISQFSIITDESEQCKKAIISKSIIPDVSLIDPEITITKDPELTAATGMDVLAHAFEALASTGSSAITETLALKAVTLVSKWLSKAVAVGNDIEARENMCFASTFAGMAFSNASLGAVHAMAHSLGGLLDLPHGECNALLLEAVVEWNFPKASSAYRKASAALGCPIGEEVPDSEAKMMLLTELKKVRESVSIEGGLSGMGVEEGVIKSLADKAVEDPCLLTNPRDTSAADLERLFRKAL